VTRFSRRLSTGVLLVAIPLAASAVFIFAGGQDLKARLGLVSSGMTREQVEELFGPPALELPILNRKGRVLVWTDMRWQVDVTLDGESRVIKCSYVPANSAYRRMQKRLTPPP
jgi:hypothetical protein